MKAYTLLMQLESEFPFERQVLQLNYNRNEPIYFYLTIQIIFPHYKAWHLFFRQESFVFIMTLYRNIYNWSARKGGGGGWITKDDIVYIQCLRPLLNIVRKKRRVSNLYNSFIYIDLNHRFSSILVGDQLLLGLIFLSYPFTACNQFDLVWG